MSKLDGIRVAALATDGVEQVELTEPVKAARDAGAQVDVIGLSEQKIQGFNHLTMADTFAVDGVIGKVDAEAYDGLILPGGVANPDTLRTVPEAVEFVRHFITENKPVAAICHGPWTLVEADVLRGRTLTSWPSLRTDIENAGGNWVDETVHVDGDLVTSRKPDDLPDFNARMIEGLEAAARARSHA